MPKGKHRRPRTNPISRGFVAAGTGGAAIALPLIGAAGAHAADTSAPTVAPERVATIAHKAAAPQAAQTGKAAKTYTVVSGDYLSKIAVEQDVRGGWKKLYADNRETVGENPSLIHPGLKLTLGVKAQAKAPAEAPGNEKAKAKASKAEAPAKADARAEAPAKAERSQARAESGSDAAQAPAAAAAAAPAPAAQSNFSGYFAPVDASMTTAYRTAGAMWSSGYHTGVDFAAPTGTSVKSVGPGTVVSAGWAGAYGNQVVIRHDDGTYSQYAHLSQLSISSGESVTGGQQIGLSGSTGNSTGPHLHFEIRTTPDYGSDMDPLAYLRQYGVSI
ncbi:LysM peptidoglycan-binding domain-containing M23 family metallopeptidase [Streptomyces sp. NPDC002133]|uniref:M23 family metallopeptidase n=1 Tax=Streptomyces sp. NPDC002133 TaxID=3154409 RepID=UPI00332FF823